MKKNKLSCNIVSHFEQVAPYVVQIKKTVDTWKEWQSYRYWLKGQAEKTNSKFEQVVDLNANGDFKFLICDPLCKMLEDAGMNK